MKHLYTFLFIVLSCFVSSAATTVFPASTNGNNIFTGNNVFTKPMAGSGDKLTNSAGSFFAPTNLPVLNHPLLVGPTVSGTLAVSGQVIATDDVDASGVFNGNALGMTNAPVNILRDNLSMTRVQEPTNSFTATADGSGGLVQDTDWTLTFYTSSGDETDNVGALATLLEPSSNGAILSGLQTSTDYRVVGRKLYRSPSGAMAWRLVTNIADNVTTSVRDPGADISGAAIPPVLNTAGGIFRLNGKTLFYSGGAKALDDPKGNTTLIGERVCDVTNVSGGCTMVGTSAGEGSLHSSENTFIGSRAGQWAVNSSGCVAMGNDSMRLCTNGTSNATYGQDSLMAVTNAVRTTGIGRQAFQFTTNLEDCVALGERAGQFNSGSGNTFLGAQSGGVGPFTNCIALGFRATVTNNSQMVVGSDAVPITQVMLDQGNVLIRSNLVCAAINQTNGSSFAQVAPGMLKLADTSGLVFFTAVSNAVSSAIKIQAGGYQQGAAGILFDSADNTSCRFTAVADATLVTFQSLTDTDLGTITRGAEVNGRIVANYAVLNPMTKAARNDLASTNNLTTGAVVFQSDNTPGLRVWNGTHWVRFTETNDD